MKYSFENGIYTVKTAFYSMELDSETIAVTMGGTEFVRLDPRTGLNTPGEGDATNFDEEGAIASFRKAEEDADSVTFIREPKSNLWEKKEYVLICREENAEYKVRVTGKGDVDSVNYFSGSMTDPGHGSHFEFCEGYAPVVGLDSSESYYFTTNKPFRRFSYLMVPPMFFYTFRCVDETARLTLALVAKPGEHNFTQFNYNLTIHRWGTHFWLWTDQSGHTKVDGTWETPSVYIYKSEDEFKAARQYSKLYFDLGYAAPKKKEKHPRFWYGPIACGWLEQLTWCYRDTYGLVWASRQNVYEEMLKVIDRRGLEPKVLIIDDKWQEEYGTARESKERWPDLPGFIRKNKAERGISTFMWYKMWDAEGIPEEYCVWDDKEKRYVVDPTNPGYLEILRGNMKYILSDEEGCLGADGLKIDFAFWQPVGRGANSYSGKYGVELFLELVRNIHDFMKEVKPYAVLNCSPSHPMFAPYCDQVRLHDYDYNQRDVMREMGERAAIFTAALGDPLVDTDGCGYNTHRDTMKYLTRAVEIGIPDTYAVSDTPFLKLSDEEWASVAQVWKKYSEEIDKMLQEND